jgi:hypothetical protein
MVERNERRRKETKPRRKSVASLTEVAQNRGLKIRRLNPVQSTSASRRQRTRRTKGRSYCDTLSIPLSREDAVRQNRMVFISVPTAMGRGFVSRASMERMSSRSPIARRS